MATSHRDPITIPETQRAWMVVRSGEPSKALRLDEHASVSRKLEKGEVLVKVQAAALNPMCVPPSVHAM